MVDGPSLSEKRSPREAPPAQQLLSPALMAVLAGPGERSAEDAQTVARNVPFAQTPEGAPLLYPGADNQLQPENLAAVFATQDDPVPGFYGAETCFDCGAGSHSDGEAVRLDGE